jgi:dTDP-4-dehydrorhamnose 3,5-epimerase
MIKDVKLMPVKVNIDDRGYLIVFASHKRKNIPNIPKMGEVYAVGDFKHGTIRGFHKHLKTWYYFFLTRGAVKFVLVDDRKNSSTKGEINTFILNEKNPVLLVVPPGVFNGWMALDDTAQLVVITSEPYNEKNPDDERVPPDKFGDVWSVKPR